MELKKEEAQLIVFALRKLQQLELCNVRKLEKRITAYAGITDKTPRMNIGYKIKRGNEQIKYITDKLLEVEDLRSKIEREYRVKAEKTI